MFDENSKKRRAVTPTPAIVGRVKILLRKKRSRLMLGILLNCTFVLGIFGYRYADYKYNARTTNVAPARQVDERCTSAAKHLASVGINFLALDFDLTIIDEHTGGRWKGSADELVEHVRPSFTCLLDAAVSEGIRVGVVTFSEQEDLISSVMAKVLDQKVPVPVRGWCCGEEDGKKEHLEAILRDVNTKMKYRLEGKRVTKWTTLLVDDDSRNIRMANTDGYRSLQYDPEAKDPWKLIESIMALQLL